MSVKNTISSLLVTLLVSFILPFTASAGVNHIDFLSINQDTASCPLIDEINVNVVCSDVNLADGSITGLKVSYTGNVTYSWQRNGVEVGNNINLVNIGPGEYRLAVTGTTGCGTVYSSYFEVMQSTLVVDFSGMKITPTSCSQANGSITGIKVPPGTIANWYDKNGGAGHHIDLTNAGPGNYTLVCNNGATCSKSFGPFTIPFSNGPNIDTSQVIITPSACGQATGSITGLKISDPAGVATYSWTDEAGKMVGAAPDIKNLQAGFYSFTAVDPTGFCEATYGPVSVINSGGPVIDASNVQMMDADCNNRFGSITGLKVTGKGSLTYSWLKDNMYPVGENLDLTNVGQGTYVLKVSDGSQCVAYSSPYTIVQLNGIALYYGTVTKTTCNSYGSVIIWPAAKFKYVWRDDTGTIVDTTQNLINAIGGKYTLTITNDCNTLSNDPVVFDLGIKRITLAAFPFTVKNTCQGANTGSIKINTDANVQSLKWLNSQGQIVGTNNEVDNLASGSYQLYITDISGCENLYGTYTVNATPILSIVANSAQVSNDACNTGTGSITGVQINGGTLPYIYSWADATGKTIANSADISNLIAGNYTLTVSDLSSCPTASASFTIQNVDDVLPAPTVSNFEPCNSHSIILQVTDTLKGNTYRLYNSLTSPNAVDEEKSGRFNVTINSNTVFYVSRVFGDCESNRTPVNLYVELSKDNIPNTISPNGDGINDKWDIPGLQNYPDASVLIFNRYGQRVFDSKGYATPFDGTFNGKNLPDGVYYYIIDLHSNCSLLSGSLTIIR